MTRMTHDSAFDSTVQTVRLPVCLSKLLLAHEPPPRNHCFSSYLLVLEGQPRNKFKAHRHHIFFVHRNARFVCSTGLKWFESDVLALLNHSVQVALFHTTEVLVPGHLRNEVEWNLQHLTLGFGVAMNHTFIVGIANSNIGKNSHDNYFCFFSVFPI